MSSEISILLKDYKNATIAESSALNRYSSPGKTWTVVYRAQQRGALTVKFKSHEYIFESENFLLFKLISANILVHWYTENTRYLPPGREFQLKDELYIKFNN